MENLCLWERKGKTTSIPLRKNTLQMNLKYTPYSKCLITKLKKVLRYL